MAFDDLTIGKEKYFLTLGLCLLWGFIINIILCLYFSEYFEKIPFPILIIAFFVFCIISCFFCKTNNPYISFLGYNLVCFPVGAILSVGIKDYSTTLIIQTLIITCFVTISMMMCGILYSKFFEKISNCLFLSLLISIIGEIITILIFGQSFKIWDFIIILIFCGYVGYDFQKAYHSEYTYVNAINYALDLYMDIVNLFLRILNISSDSKK